MQLYQPTESELSHFTDLLKAAREVRPRSYSTYSNFSVGAAILTSNGNTYVGCNVEYANYDIICAEASALSAMIIGGDHTPSLIAAVGGHANIHSPFAMPVQPCGRCRQRLMEFSMLSGVDPRILKFDENGHKFYQLLSELLPDAFGPSNLTATK